MGNKTHFLVDIDKACRTVIDFIGTDNYNKVISSIEDTAKAGFTAGLSFAMCLAMSTADKYVLCEEEKKQEGGEHERIVENETASDNQRETDSDCEMDYPQSREET